MQSGVSTKPQLGRWVIYVLVLLMLHHLCLAAPGQPATHRDEAVDSKPSGAPLANPFSSGEEDRRLLQSFIHSSLKDSEIEPELNTWEQEVFLLLRLFDFDRSGFLDGLEMMKLLSDYNTHHAPEAQASEKVVSMVDFLLQTQDLNQDGLLAPSELLSPPLPQSQDAENLREPQQKDEVPGEQEQQDETHVDTQPQEGQQVEVEVKAMEDEQHGQQIPEVPAAEQEQAHQVPVHQGQPEI
ncbi:cell growth regulator with EF hand domain protein 1 isoform X2 [Nelusetta ayraudi]|uniref:cell growth regulator with EF hand domain protein 1 isoform X2 n=1 Tax=Nelusetta ayraudi TaxID=303726 RepID=UPI003F6E9D58